jgi:hypothetical protein
LIWILFTHGFVVIIEVDPAAKSADDVAPSGGIAHDDLAAFVVVFLNAELHVFLRREEVQLFVDLVFDRQAVTVPAEASFDVESVLAGITSADILEEMLEGGTNMP